MHSRLGANIALRDAVPRSPSSKDLSLMLRKANSSSDECRSVGLVDCLQALVRSTLKSMKLWELDSLRCEL